MSLGTIAGLAIGLIGIVVTIIIALRSAERKKPTYHGVTYLKITKSQDAPPDLQIAFKGERVDRVSSTFIWFWNEGRKPIRRDDIPTTQPLVLRIRDGTANPTILDFAVLRMSRTAVNFQAAKQNDTSLLLTFDFLDFNDGAVLEVQHIGGPLSLPEITGVVLGAPDGIRRRLRVLTGERKRKVMERSSLPGLAAQYQQSARPSKRRQTKLTCIVTGFIAVAAWLLVWVVRKVPPTINLSSENARTVLRSYLSGSQLDSALHGLESAGAERGGFVIFISIVTFVWLLAMYAVWSRDYVFPDSLLLGGEKEGS
jgi:hypothetical protein